MSYEGINCLQIRFLVWNKFGKFIRLKGGASEKKAEMELTEMEFPHQEKKPAARFPLFGPENSKTLLAQIKHEEFREPTFPELVSFIHRYFNEEGRYAGKVREIMKTKYLIGFTGILYLPGSKEVRFIDYPSFERRSVVDVDNLETRLRMRGSRAKVSLENVETGSLPLDKIATNPLIIALCDGEEGAEKLAEIASWHPGKKCHLFVPVITNFSSPQARMPLLYSYDKGTSLTVSLNGSGCSINSYSFGLIK